MEPQEQPRLVDELKQMQKEPLLPIERKLVLWSIVLGIVLLVVLSWVSVRFFPAK